MHTYKNSLIFSATFVLSFFFFVVLAHAADTPYENFVPLEPSFSGEVSEGNFGVYFKTLYNRGIAIAGVLAVLFLVIGGFQYMLSESVFDKKGAKDRISAALIGLVLALASYLILRTINPDLVEFNIKIQKTNPIEVAPYDETTALQTGNRSAWCKKNTKLGTENCSYNSKEACEDSISGLLSSVLPDFTCSQRISNPSTNEGPPEKNYANLFKSCTETYMVKKSQEMSACLLENKSEQVCSTQVFPGGTEADKDNRNSICTKETNAALGL